MEEFASNTNKNSATPSEKEEITEKKTITMTSGFPEQEKALDNLRDIIKPLNAFLKNEGCPIKHDFGIDKIDSKKGEDPNGPMLAYIAQMIRSNIINNVGTKPTVVVAAALAQYDTGKYGFIIGVNFHNDFDREVGNIMECIPTEIAGIEVVTVVDRVYDRKGGQNWHQRHRATKMLKTTLDNIKEKVESGKHSETDKKDKKVKRTDQLPDKTTILSWHVEQKVLCAIKNNSPKARKSVTALGIAHTPGPCTFETAGIGTNHCAEYLKRKLAKAENPEDPGNGPVAAFWYEKTPFTGQTAACSIRKIPMTMPGQKRADTNLKVSSDKKRSDGSDDRGGKKPKWQKKTDQ